MINLNENILSVMVEIDTYERLFTDQSRQHTLIIPWMTELVLLFQSFFLRSAVSFKNVFQVLGISKIDLL